MMKAVLKLDSHDDKAKRKAMKKVSRLSGVDSISMDMKGKKLTVIGDVDPVHIVSKLRKLCNTELITVGPAKEPEKKKEDPKKQDPKKIEDQKAVWDMYHQPYYPYMISHRSVEEDPNACVIS